MDPNADPNASDSFDWSGLADEINGWALSWYQATTQPHPTQLPPGTPGIAGTSIPGGVALSISPAVLILIGGVALFFVLRR